MSYKAIWTMSQRGFPSVDYDSVAFPGITFTFVKKSKGMVGTKQYRCSNCTRASKIRKKRGAPHLTIPAVRANPDDGFLDDPDNPLHRHFCIDEDGLDNSTFYARARQIYNKIKLELEEQPTAPLDAYRTMENEIVNNFPDPEIQKEIIQRLPNLKSARRSFARRSAAGRKDLDISDARIIDPRNLPDDMNCPIGTRLPGLAGLKNRDLLDDFFVIFQEARPTFPPFLVFSDLMGVNLLHKCPDIICDGDSNFYPKDFAQLYTFHAVHPSLPDEAHLFAFALLPSTSATTYTKLFDILSQRLHDEYGDHGVKKTWHFDNQIAAINGCRDTFFEDVVQSSDQRITSFAQVWHTHLFGLFTNKHPTLARFIRIMKAELARATIIAERIFYPNGVSCLEENSSFLAQTEDDADNNVVDKVDEMGENEFVGVEFDDGEDDDVVDGDNTDDQDDEFLPKKRKR